MRLSAQESIDKKLGTIFLGAILFCLLVTVVGYITTMLFYSMQSFTQELSSVAQVAAATSRASLVFNDPEAGSRVLSGLQAKPSIVYAGLYKTDGSLVSEYGDREDDAYREGSPADKNQYSWSLTRVRLSVPVILENDRIGYLVVVSSLATLYQQLALFFCIALAIALVAGLGALHFRAVLRHLVSEPIVSLRDMALQVTLTKDFSARIPASRNESDEIGQLMATFNGMLDQLEERNRALLLAKNRAEDADKLKSIFLATVSHELRTPLHAILGITEELQHTPVSEEQRELLEIVSTSGSLLISIISDILDFSKIEAGKLVLAPSVISLEEYLLRLVNMFSLAARKKGLELSIVVNPDVPEVISIDGSRLIQVLVNLVGNALKFTQKGSVTIQVSKSERFTRKGYLSLAFAIIDTGIGIPEHSLGSIFDSFTQVRRERDPQQGTGLGLTISSRLVQLMGGIIWAESLMHKGSTFHFTIEVPELGEAVVAAKSADPALVRVDEPSRIWEAASFTVLVVEDNKVNSLLAVRVLTKAGYRVLVATNGQECLALLEREHVDLILMDINMPIMDGIQATIRIRAKEAISGGHVQIVALTANALDDQSTTCMDAGIDEYLTKPLDSAKLLKTIAVRLDSRRSKIHLVAEPLAEPIADSTTDSSADTVAVSADAACSLDLEHK